MINFICEYCSYKSSFDKEEEIKLVKIKLFKDKLKRQDLYKCPKCGRGITAKVKNEKNNTNRYKTGS